MISGFCPGAFKRKIMVQNKKTGMSRNWVESEANLARIAEAKKYREKAKEEEVGKKYIRVPHPTLKNTFILKEKE
jgi:hypothetical protein